MSQSGMTFDLRDRRDDDIERDGETARVEPWPNVSASSRLFYDYECDQSAGAADPQIHLNFGRAALELNQGLETYAIEALRKYIGARPDDAAGHYHLGAAYTCKSAHRDAAAAYEQAVKLSPDDADFLMALHFAYFSLLRFEDAIACVERVIKIVRRQRKEKLDESLFTVWKGIDLLLAGRADQVEQLLKPGTRFEGTTGQAAHFGLALLALQEENQGEVEQHRSYLEKVESPLLPALTAAIRRGHVEPREAVHALTGRTGTA